MTKGEAVVVMNALASVELAQPAFMKYLDEKTFEQVQNRIIKRIQQQYPDVYNHYLPLLKMNNGCSESDTVEVSEDGNVKTVFDEGSKPLGEEYTTEKLFSKYEDNFGCDLPFERQP